MTSNCLQTVCTDFKTAFLQKPNLNNSKIEELQIYQFFEHQKHFYKFNCNSIPIFHIITLKLNKKWMYRMILYKTQYNNIPLTLNSTLFFFSILRNIAEGLKNEYKKNKLWVWKKNCGMFGFRKGWINTKEKNKVYQSRLEHSCAGMHFFLIIKTWLLVLQDLHHILWPTFILFYAESSRSQRSFIFYYLLNHFPLQLSVL